MSTVNGDRCLMTINCTYDEPSASGSYWFRLGTDEVAFSMTRDPLTGDDFDNAAELFESSYSSAAVSLPVKGMCIQPCLVT